MADLIKRLRNRASCGPYMGAEHGQTVFQLKEAADALEAMRDALRGVAADYNDGKLPKLQTHPDPFFEYYSPAGAGIRSETVVAVYEALSKLDGKEPK